MKKLIIILLIFQPLVNKITLKAGVSFDVYNELLSLLVLCLFLVQILNRGKITSIFLVFLSLLGYMGFVVFLRGIGVRGYFQVLIYCQWFFFFLYFFGLDRDTKRKLILDLKYILDRILIFILFISLFEIPFYEKFRNLLGVTGQARGLGGFYLISFFGSGPSLANFMSYYILVWFYYHYGIKKRINRIDKILIASAFVIIILSFSRKEVLFVFLFLLFFPFSYRNRLVKWVRKTIVFMGILAGLLIYYFAFFSKANEVAFGDRYIRWRIAEKSYEILADNLPWGSGPGTFGSRASLMNTEVYEKYGVGQEMLGWKVLNQTRGPIYDAFLFTFTTEIGIGILIYLFFFFKLFEGRVLDETLVKAYIKNFLLLYFFGLSLFQPVLTSSFGYLCAILLGLAINRISLTKFRRTYAKI